MQNECWKICVVGLGYVGLPLAVSFSKKYKVVGYDTNQKRIEELNNGIDRTNELDGNELEQLKKVKLIDKLAAAIECNVYIVTVPTPIDANKQPDLSPVIAATETISKVIKEGDIVIFESTVYPGVTEEICVPVLETSGLKYNDDFFVGYSPERINPGDKTKKFENILKITSGSRPDIAKKIDALYSSVVIAGTYSAESIKVAEAAKVIENVQRDVNIALTNEFHYIFSKLDINTLDVLKAASTKWNFMHLTPGLVGGHCIGVDPYYLLHKSIEKGYVPDLIRKSREINDSMPKFIIDNFIKFVINENFIIKKAKVAVLGLAFKGNCPDIRNSKAIDVVNLLKEYGITFDVFDSYANHEEVYSEYGIELKSDENIYDYDIALKLVDHDTYERSLIISRNKKIKFFDYKSII